MVIGGGILARAFFNFADDDSVVIFASGVSRSNETDPACFTRELDLLKATIAELKPYQLLIYFSTCSVDDPSLQESHYIRHKRTIERMIINDVKQFIIFRLPIVVSRSDNPHTLTNFLASQIKENKIFTFFRHAYRYLADIEDVKETISKIIENRLFLNRVINIIFYKAVPVLSIINTFGRLYGKEPLYTESNDGSFYMINSPEDAFWLNKYANMEEKEYIDRIIEKYYAR